MKVRMGFISNSSSSSFLASSSFIVFEDLSSRGIPCLKLSNEQMNRIDGFRHFEGEPAIHFNGRQGFLTKFIVNRCYGIENDILESVEWHYYANGNNCKPCKDDCYNEHKFGKNSFYILKDHDSAEQMTISQFEAKNKR